MFFVDPQVKDLHVFNLERPTKNEKRYFVKKAETKTGKMKFKRIEKTDIVKIKAKGKIIA